MIVPRFDGGSSQKKRSVEKGESLVTSVFAPSLKLVGGHIMDLVRRLVLWFVMNPDACVYASCGL